MFILRMFPFIFLWLLIQLSCEFASSLGGQLSNADKLNNVKRNVLKHYERQYFSDVHSIGNSTWFFEKFLQEYNYNEKTTEKAIIEAFDFFHAEELHLINDTYFPSEAYAVGSLYGFGTSKFGQPLVGIVMNHIKPLRPKLTKESIIKLTEKFCLYFIYKTMFEAKEKNFVTYVVFTNASMENTEFKFSLAIGRGLFQKTMLAINKHFAGVPLKIYMVDMSKTMEISIRILSKLFKSSLKERLTFVDRIEQTKDMISLHEIPVHAGGLNKNFERIPPGVKSGKCLPHLSSITPQEWDIYRAINSDAIEEGMREKNIESMNQYLRSCDKLKSN